MKNLNFLLIVILGLTSCGPTSSKNDDFEKEQNQSQVQIKEDISRPKEQTKNVLTENKKEKFLISNNSAGYFKVGGSWQSLAKNDYHFNSVQSYGTCIDACCDGGFDLGNNLIINKYGYADNPELTIGALLFKRSESYDDEVERNKYISNKDVFYISSDNCNGWFWKDNIEYIVVNSDLFTTKEEVGVGATLEEAQEIFGKLDFHIGWIEEDVNALQFVTKSYPNISFILDVDDYQGNWEDITRTEDENTLTASDFKEDTKIQRIIIHRKN